MKKSFIFSMLVALLTISLLISCNNTDEINPADKNTVTLQFDNRVGIQDLMLNSQTYKNAAGEDFKVTRLNYFISNIKLKKADGAEVTFPNQYFLLKETDANSMAIKLNDVPAADYNNISFTIGVDSLKSISDITQRIGVLDPASYGDDNMYWSWNSGYIFLKFEGTSPAILPNAAGAQVFQIHSGGFGGRTALTPNNLRTTTLPLAMALKVRKTGAPQLKIYADVAKILSGTSTVSFAKGSVLMSPMSCVPIANNYAKMFSVEQVSN